jgi:hypothetical protein
LSLSIEGDALTSRRPIAFTAGTIVLALLVAAGCTRTSGNAGTGNASPGVAASGALALKGVCPDPLVVMTPWYPEAELGELYQLLGPDPQIDATHKRVTGKLLAQGTDTGVRLELRAGGPAIGFQPVGAQMYLDKTITLGMPPLDEQIETSEQQPTLAVVAPLEKDPVAIGWDPTKHPDAKTIADIGKIGIPVVAFPSAFIDYLVNSGILKRGQIDNSYDGSPARYISSDVAVTPFATNEPYTFEKEVKPGKPMRVQLLYDAGYPNYRNLLAIRTADKNTLAPCLKKLVPIIQRAQIDFTSKPAPIIELLLKLNNDYKGGFVYSRGNAEFSVQQMKSLQIVGNGADQTLGNFDEARVQRMIGITGPIFAAQKKPVKSGLKPSDVVTNEFIDPTIGLQP